MRSGEEHGQRTHRWVDLRAAVGAGLLVGALFCAWELIVNHWLGGGTWGPLRLVAALVLGPRWVEQSPWHGMLAMGLALALHLAVSAMLAIAAFLAYHRLRHWPAALLGVTVGFLLYILNFYVVSASVSWFAEARSLSALLLHVGFGVLVAATYHRLRAGGWRGGEEHGGLGETHTSVGRLPLDVDWNASLWRGLASGAAYIVVEMTVTSLLEPQERWMGLRLIASIALGPDVLPAAGQPVTFSARVLVAAMVVHFTLSLIYNVISGVIFHWLPDRAVLAAGLIKGLSLYIINFHGFAVMFPWFVHARGWQPIFVHAVYGLSSAGGHLVLRRRAASPGGQAGRARARRSAVSGGGRP